MSRLGPRPLLHKLNVSGKDYVDMDLVLWFEDFFKLNLQGFSQIRRVERCILLSEFSLCFFSDLRRFRKRPIPCFGLIIAFDDLLKQLVSSPEFHRRTEAVQRQPPLGGIELIYESNNVW
jgi:hypothetical protein